MYLERGKLTLEQNGKTVTAKDGDLLLVDCYRPHTYFSEVEAKTVWIHFDGNESRRWFEEITAAQGQKIHLPPTAVECLQKAVDSVRKNKNEYAVSKNIYALLCEMMRPDRTVPTNTETREAIRIAEKYIREHFAEPLTVAEIAEQTHFSESYFNKIFRKVTGVSPYEYLLKVRLEQAKALLIQTELSVSDVAFQTGFNSASNFLYFFKKQTGLSALQFRKMKF